MRPDDIFLMKFVAFILWTVVVYKWGYYKGHDDD
jgi:hypothetical protein